MLRIYSVMLDYVCELDSVIRQVESRDRSLGGQLRRSITSVVLNTAEGMGASKGCKVRAYRVALGEMREANAAIEIATRLRYVGDSGRTLLSGNDGLRGRS